MWQGLWFNLTRWMWISKHTCTCQHKHENFLSKFKADLSRFIPGRVQNNENTVIRFEHVKFIKRKTFQGLLWTFLHTKPPKLTCCLVSSDNTLFASLHAQVFFINHFTEGKPFLKERKLFKDRNMLVNMIYFDCNWTYLPVTYCYHCRKNPVTMFTLPLFYPDCLKIHYLMKTLPCLENGKFIEYWVNCSFL